MFIISNGKIIHILVLVLWDRASVSCEYPQIPSVAQITSDSQFSCVGLLSNVTLAWVTLCVWFVCVHVWKCGSQRLTLGIFPYLFSPCFLSQGLSLSHKLSNCPEWMAKEPQGSSHLCPLTLGQWVHAPYSHFSFILMWVLGIQIQVLVLFPVRALCTEPSPHSLGVTFQFFSMTFWTLNLLKP